MMKIPSWLIVSVPGILAVLAGAHHHAARAREVEGGEPLLEVTGVLLVELDQQLLDVGIGLDWDPRGEAFSLDLGLVGLDQILVVGLEVYLVIG